MFADPRTRASLVENFFSDWLQARNVRLLNPDGTKFPWFDDNLRGAFLTEDGNVSGRSNSKKTTAWWTC